MHVRTRLRRAIKRRLIAANIAGGRVYSRDPRGSRSFAGFPFVVIEPIAEKKIDVSGARKFAIDIARADNRKVGRVQQRTIQVAITIIAKDEGVEDEFENMVELEVDADEAADAISVEIEAALFDGDNRLMTEDADGTAIPLGEKELMLHGTSGLLNPETGSREIGTVHMLWEALIFTSEGDPERVVGGSNRT